MATVAKEERLQTRISSEAKRCIEQAAHILGTTTSGFVNQVAVERAQEVVKKRRVPSLSDRDRDTFLKLLEEDTPNDNLKEAARKRRELLRD